GGVYLGCGGNVSNAGLISGAFGILGSSYSGHHPATVVNVGTVSAVGTFTSPHGGRSVNAGVNLEGGGIVVNGGSGTGTALIKGAIGVFMHYAYPEMVVNLGTIAGTR